MQAAALAARQAAINDDLAMLEPRVARGARLDIRDALWNGTPLGWAVHQGKRQAEAYLRRVTEAAREGAAGDGQGQ